MNSCKSYQTKQKNIIKELFINHPQNHYTVEEILNLLVTSSTPVSKATLYRTLDSLVVAGDIIRYNLDGVCSCYQFNDCSSEVNNHIHFRCENCGHIFHINSSVVKSMDKKLEKEYGFVIDNKRTMLYGICDKCKEVE